MQSITPILMSMTRETLAYVWVLVSIMAAGILLSIPSVIIVVAYRKIKNLKGR